MAQGSWEEAVLVGSVAPRAEVRKASRTHLWRLGEV